MSIEDTDPRRVRCRAAVIALVILIVLAGIAGLIGGVLARLATKPSFSSSGGLFEKMTDPVGSNYFSVFLYPAEEALGAYEIPMSMGSPSSNMSILLDSGSADFWVLNDTNGYPSSSTSFVQLADSGYTQSYGSGDVEGYFGNDTCSINGFTWSQQFALITSSSGYLGDTTGLMGFARGCSPNGYDDEYLCAWSYWQLQQRVVSFYYDSLNWNGLFTAGYINESLYCKQGTSLTYMPLLNEQLGDYYYWVGRVDMLVDGKLVGDGIRAIFDTGTTYMYLADTLFDAVTTAAIDKSCVNPEVSFRIRGKIFTIPDSVFTGSPTDPSLTCGMRLYNWIPGPGYDALIGAVFLINYYVVFDLANLRLGFCEPQQGLSDGASVNQIGDIIDVKRPAKVIKRF